MQAERAGDRERLHGLLSDRVEEGGGQREGAETHFITTVEAVALARRILDNYERGCLLAEAARVIDANRRKAEAQKEKITWKPHFR